MVESKRRVDCVRDEEEDRRLCVVDVEIRLDEYCFGRKVGESRSVNEGDWGADGGWMELVLVGVVATSFPLRVVFS